MIQHSVKATREGDIGKTTSSEYVIETHVNFVALPSTGALHRAVCILNPATGKQCDAVVLDVGPWNTHDDSYVFGEARPQAESDISVSGEGTNRSGIDLGEWVWAALGMEDNTDVIWWFPVTTEVES